MKLLLQGELILSGNEILMYFGALALGVGVCIAGYRAWEAKQTKDTAGNVLRHTRLASWGALCLALLVTWMAFSWTQKVEEYDMGEVSLDIPLEVITDPPVVPKPKKLPPPELPKKSNKILEVELKLPEVKLPEIKEPEIKSPITSTGKFSKEPALFPSLDGSEDGFDDGTDDKKPEIKPDAPLEVSEIMPRFEGCEDINGTEEEKRLCANAKFQRFLVENLRYPSMCKEVGVSGRVFVEFTVMDNGEVKDLKILKEPGGCGLGKEVLRVFDVMQRKGYTWIPGKQNGQNVSVKYRLPVVFNLEK